MLQYLLPALPALIGSIVRTTTIAGGAAAVATAEVGATVVSDGALTSGDIQAAAGAIGIALGAIWSIVEKLRRKPA